MVHKGTKIIKTNRLTLRPFNERDASAMYQNWTSDNEVSKYLTWPTHASVEVSRELLKEWVQIYGNLNYYNWCIHLNEIDQPVGSITVVRMNEQVKSAEIGYCIGRRYWNQGITSESFKAVINYLIKDVGFNRVMAKHDVRNPSSGIVMEKCGLLFEGILRQAYVNNLGICDVKVYSILASDL